MALKSIIHSDPNIHSGDPVFVGTRIPARALLDYIDGGDSLDAFLDNFPSVSREQAVAFLEEAGRAATAITAMVDGIYANESSGLDPVLQSIQTRSVKNDE